MRPPTDAPPQPKDANAASERAASGDAVFIRRCLILVGIAALAWLLWTLADVLLLVFAAVLVAILFRSLADLLRKRLGLPQKIALAASIALIFGLLGSAGYAFGAEVAAQFRSLSESLPHAMTRLAERLEDIWLGDRIQQWIDQVAPQGSSILAMIQQAVTGLGGALANLFVIVVAGIYLAAQSDIYRKGLLKLVPRTSRELAGLAMRDSGRALKLWLVGQLALMLIVGVLTGIGLWLIGVPSALTLGLLAGLLEFVPVIGPVIAAIPALLIAATQGTEALLWTLALFVVLQQVESNILQPLIQQRAVELPPALMLFALVAAGLLFGVAGLLLASPLTVLAYVLVKRLYVREALDTPTSIPGEEEGKRGGAAPA